MSTPTTGQKTIAQIFDEIGVPEASSLCLAIYNFLHLIDDFQDRDVELKEDEIAFTLLGFFQEMATNSFWHKHATDLMPVIHCSVMAWIASDRLRKSEVIQDRIVAETLKSEYQNIFFRVAFLARGPQFAYSFEREYRSYDFT